MLQRCECYIVMSGYTLQYTIRNTSFEVKIGVDPNVQKMVEYRLRWFGHVGRLFKTL